MFERFPSLTRFSQGWSISEKIDGTNAQVFIANLIDPNINHAQSVARVGDLYIFAGSRSRLITPDNDNHGFARWVRDNAEMLVSTLGEGRHFGEWWGRGIQRGYGLDEKRFSLFNTLRWKQEDLPEGLYVVPCIINNEYLNSPGTTAESALFELKEKGSLAAPGFMDPEGIVMFHRASGVAFKKTFDYDEFGKWMENQERKQNG
jgi:hypothetical protein